MNKYVIGYLSLFDGDLLLEEVEANSALEASFKYLEYEEGDKEGISSMNDLFDRLCNQDIHFNVIKLNSSRSGRSGSDLQNRSVQLDSAASFH
jgi:hypothetical protein